MTFSIVTPAYNAERWIRETIESVLSQRGDFSIEYILCDGGSTDKTQTIIAEYVDKIQQGTFPIACRAVTMRWSSQRDGGMYDAINRGFSTATGDIYAWINADDRYEPEAFHHIQTALKTYPDIQWLKGMTQTIDEHSSVVRSGACHLYYQDWLRQGLYGQEAYYVEQDSVFWRAPLWRTVGGIPTKLRLAGDYWLWIQFAHLAPLWSLQALVSSFRKRQGQLSRDISRYKAEQHAIRPKRTALAWCVRLFFGAQARLSALSLQAEPLFTKLYPHVFRRTQTYLAYRTDTLVKKITSSMNAE